MNALGKIINHYELGEYHCENLIIGSGAGGSVAASVLSQKDTIILEEGKNFETKDFQETRPSLLIRDLYRNGGAIPFFGRPLIGFAEARCVGGGTVANGGILTRPDDDIIDSWKHLVSPEELNGLFERIEGRIGHKDTDISPGNLDSQLLYDAGKKNGLRTSKSMRTVKGCQNSNTCPTGCPTGAKQSANLNYLKDGLESGRLRVFSELRCEKLKLEGRRGKYIDATTKENKRIRIYFSFIFFASGPVQTPSILRKSGVKLGEKSRILYHTPLKILAEFKTEINAENGTSSKSVVSFDGFKVATSNVRKEYVAMTALSHGMSEVNYFLKQYQRVGIYMALLKSKSYGRLRLNFNGQPIVQNIFDKDDLLLAKRALIETSKLLFSEGAVKLLLPMRNAGPVKNMDDLKHEVSKLQKKNLDILTVHAMGSCKMGDRPQDSVVSPSGKLWGYENVYIVDSSVIPTTTGCGPQLTAMAFALKISEGFVNDNY